MAERAERKLRVFVSHATLPASGTDRSFQAEAEDVVWRAGHEPVEERNFRREGPGAAEDCIAQIRGCEILLLLLGPRFGSWTGERRTMSYTELEYRAAREYGLEILPFFLRDMDRGDNWHDPDMEKRRARDRFHDRVRDECQYDVFGNAYELRGKIERELPRVAARYRRMENVRQAQRLRLQLRRLGYGVAAVVAVVLVLVAATVFSSGGDDAVVPPAAPVPRTASAVLDESSVERELAERAQQDAPQAQKLVGRSVVQLSTLGPGIRVECGTPPVCPTDKQSPQYIRDQLRKLTGPPWNGIVIDLHDYYVISSADPGTARWAVLLPTAFSESGATSWCNSPYNGGRSNGTTCLSGLLRR